MKPFRLLSLLVPALLLVWLPLASVAAADPGPLTPVTVSVGDVTQQLPLDTPTPTATEPPPTAPPTETPTDPPPTVTPTDPPTATPTATTPPQPGFHRPLVVITSYRARPGAITPGGSFNLELQVANQGQLTATNVVVAFTAGELIPRNSGGVLAVGAMSPGESRSLSQGFVASSSLTGLGAVTLEARVSYTDENGTSFSESFAIAINSTLPQPTSRPSGPVGPTPTPTAAVRSQLIVLDTRTDVALLQPGTRFMLELDVANVGNADARSVTMVAGGATVSPSDPTDPGAPQGQGGVTSSGGEFTNFSPLGASNIQSLGDIPAGGTIVARQPLIVNVSTNPGAYSFKISFVYYDDKGTLIVDDQVITLLVYLQPVVEVSFYRPPDPFFAGQPAGLPLQIINLGRKSVVLGNMRVTASAGQMINNTILIGPLDAGGYFTLDSTLIPDAPGPMELTITVDYNDDFNQAQTITRTLQVEVMEAPIIEEPPVDPGVDPGVGGPAPIGEETFGQLVMRFLRGMIGLDSAHTVADAGGPPGEMPGEIPLDGPAGSPAPVQ
jgi:hypothetical protein